MQHFVSVLLVVCAQCVQPHQITDVNAESVTYKSLIGSIREAVRPLVANAYSSVFEAVTDPALSSNCSNRLLKLLIGANNNEVWALRIVLSNGLISPNLFEGSLGALGGYSQCVKSRNLDASLRGSYCTTYFKVPRQSIADLESEFQKYGYMLGRRRLDALDDNPVWGYSGLRAGLCFLDGCSEQELTHLLQTLLADFGVQVTVANCETNEPRPWLWRHSLISSFFAIWLLLVVVGTIIERNGASHSFERNQLSTHSTCSRPENSNATIEPKFETTKKFLLCFSLIQNGRRLADTTISSKSLAFLNGMKVLLSLWVVYAHGFLLSQHYSVDPGFAMFDLQTRLSHNLGLGSSYLSVSSFFFITGFLIGYSILRKQAKILTKNYLLYCARQYVRRYFRLTVPLVAVLLCFLMTDLVTYGASDGKSDFFRREFDSCVSYWPSLLLHYINFLPWNKHCLDEVWYIAAEMQLYIFALPLTLILIKSTRMFLVLILIITSASCIYTLHETRLRDLHPALSLGFPSINKIVETADIIYHKPWSHAPTYVLGILCSHCVVHHGKIQFNRMSQAILWWVSIVLTLSLMGVNTVWNGAENDASIPYRRLLYAFYGSSHRLLWGIAKFWIVYALATGRGGVLYSFFSWKGFHVISKLSYGIFLTHYPILLVRVGRVSTSSQMDLFILISDALGRWVLAAVAATLLHLFFESPAVNFERFFSEWKSSTHSVKRVSESFGQSSDAHSMPEKSQNNIIIVKAQQESEL